MSGKIVRENKKILDILFPCTIVVLIVMGLFIYQTRRVPELGDEIQVTKLPPDVEKTLGVTTGPGVAQNLSLRIPILLYHYVEYIQNDPGRQNLNIPPNILTQQIETLKQAGYTFITPNDMTAALNGKKKLSQKIVMLSFDDGYMDFYMDVFPILKQEKVKSVAYIVPDFLNRPNYMFTLQLQEVAKSPYVEIGAHTMDHLWLAGLDKTTAQYQIAESRKTLQDMLHLPINSFAYPYGAFDQQAIQIVKNAGFSNAASTLPGIIDTKENEFFFYRLRPGYRTGQELLNFLAQNTFQPW